MIDVEVKCVGLDAWAVFVDGEPLWEEETIEAAIEVSDAIDSGVRRFHDELEESNAVLLIVEKIARAFDDEAITAATAMKAIQALTERYEGGFDYRTTPEAEANAIEAVDKLPKRRRWLREEKGRAAFRQSTNRMMLKRA